MLLPFVAIKSSKQRVRLQAYVDHMSGIQRARRVIHRRVPPRSYAVGTPVAPLTAAAVATFMELPVAFAVAIGALTRPAAVLMFFYTLGTALIGHRYWTNDGVRIEFDGMDSFFKNLSIMGGFLLLYITGAGKYSIDRSFSIATPAQHLLR